MPTEAPSPVVPNTVTLSQPLETHQRAWVVRRPKSSAPPDAKGVASATDRPKRDGVSGIVGTPVK